MKTSIAIGALALAAIAGSANAGISWTSADVYLDVNSAASYLASDFATASLGGSASDGSASLSLSPITASGFQINAASTGGIWSVYSASFGFTANSAVTVELTGDTDAEAATILLFDTTDASVPFLRAVGGAGAWTSGLLTLTAGHNYLVGVNPGIANGSMETGSVLNFNVIPAPGAAALLGMGGLLAARRRR